MSAPALTCRAEPMAMHGLTWRDAIDALGPPEAAIAGGRHAQFEGRELSIRNKRFHFPLIGDQSAPLGTSVAGNMGAMKSAMNDILAPDGQVRYQRQACVEAS